MRQLTTRDVPPRAAAIVVALALLAGAVTGNEQAVVPPQVSEPQAPPPAPAVDAGELDLEKLARRARASEPVDLFATVAPAPSAAKPVVTAAPVPAGPPAAPALPFRYLGRMADGERQLVFLERNGEPIRVAAGDAIEGLYRVDSVSVSSVVFTYLPLGVTQTLAIPAPN